MHEFYIEFIDNFGEFSTITEQKCLIWSHSLKKETPEGEILLQMKTFALFIAHQFVRMFVNSSE